MIKGLLIDPEMHIYRVRKVIDTAEKSKVVKSKILIKMKKKLIEQAEAFLLDYEKAL